jgi:phosphohistidine swiveling domain-containing protein
MVYKFQTKARTLQFLEGKISQGIVLPQISFSLKDWKESKNEILKCIKAKFPCVIVRSSSCQEDTDSSSMAGAFDSILNVDTQTDGLLQAIETVISSYGVYEPANEVLVQPFLKDVSASGVAFTADPDTLSSYYIVNYDVSGSTDSITSGQSKSDKTFISFKSQIGMDAIKEPWLKKLISSLSELETLLKNPHLDVEFAVSSDQIYILQVRPIVKDGKDNLSDIDLIGPLERLERKIQKLSYQHPRVLGSKALFGIMPDWNPAEIIGLRPGRLSLSLYKELVTDNIWAYQRFNYGYRDLRSHPLMVSFLGVPYIDVRLSFNSFVPQELDEKIASKLVDYYLDELESNPHHHDKVEFEIVLSCFVPGIEKKRPTLSKKGFSDKEIDSIFSSLKKITDLVLRPKEEKGIVYSDLDKIKTLQRSYDQIVSSQLSLVDKIYWLTEDCKRYGTLPFAGIARSGFIATQLLNSFVSENAMTVHEKEEFLGAIKTVSKQMCDDHCSMSKEDFLENYGHLRPGTYDILSPRYDEDYDGYFSAGLPPTSSSESFNPSEDLLNRLQKLLLNAGIERDARSVLEFIRISIEGREWSKFVFTRSLSKTLQLIEEFGKKLFLNKEDMAFVDFAQIKALYSSLDHEIVGIYFKTNIEQNLREYAITKAIKLPSLIRNSQDVYSYLVDESLPNFVTLKKIKGEIAHVQGNKDNLSGKIALIPNADPGFDFLFTKNIVGLITCYGGGNSHMAVRCAELGIPAAIGVGELLYKEIDEAKIVELDALNRQLKIIQ